MSIQSYKKTIRNIVKTVHRCQNLANKIDALEKLQQGHQGIGARGATFANFLPVFDGTPLAFKMFSMNWKIQQNSGNGAKALPLRLQK